MSEKTTSNPAKKPGKKQFHPPRRQHEHHEKHNHEDGQGGSQNRRHQRNPHNHKVDMRKYEKLISDIQNNFADIHTSNGAKDDCTICCKTSDIFGIGECRHPVCIECAIRIRVLNKQNTCPVCRQENELIYLVFASAGLETVPLNFPKHGHPAEERYGIRFQDGSVAERYEQYLAHVCKICKTSDGDRLEFPTFNALRQHMVNSHQLTYCSICTDNLDLYSRERRTYNRQALQRHIREGDVEDKSQKGHPTCLFCDERFFDNEAQYRHLRKEHFFCQFCESDGTMTNAFFNKHEELLNHYKLKHYRCEHENCRSLGIAFSNVVEFNLHQTQHTGKGVHLDFQYNDRQPVGHGRRERNDYRRDRNDYRAQPNERIAVVPADPPPPPIPRPNTEIIVVPSAQSRNVRIGYHHVYNHRVEDFPTLGGAPGPSVSSGPPVVVPQDFPRLNKVGKGQKQPKKQGEDFPTLGGRATNCAATGQNAQWAKHTGGFAVIDVDERAESVSKPQAIRNNAPPIRTNQPPELQQKQKPVKKAGPIPSEDFPSLPVSSGSGALATKSNWAARTKGKNAITGVMVPKKKPLPVPDVWPDLNRPATASIYQPVEETWEDVPYNRKLTVRERRELQKKQQEAETMEREEMQKQIEKQMMIPPDEDLEMQAILMNDISSSSQKSSENSQNKKKSKKDKVLKDKNAYSKVASQDKSAATKEKPSMSEEERRGKAAAEFPSLQSTVQNSPPKKPPTPEPESSGSGGISSWLFSSVSNVLGNLSLSNVLGEHTQPLSSMVAPSAPPQKEKDNVPPGLPNTPTTSSNTTNAQISYDAPPGFESFVPQSGPPPGLGYSNDNLFSSAPMLSHQDLTRPQANSDDWSYNKSKARAK